MLLFAACSDTATALSESTEPSAAAANVVSDGQDGQLITDQYIVVFKTSVANSPELARLLATEERVTLVHRYSRALKGFCRGMRASAAARLRQNSMVEFVEQDQVVKAVATKTGATWGLDRIDQRGSPLSTTYSYTIAGAGTTVHIIDTGIEIARSDSNGRATVLSDHVVESRNGIDCNGHGTHVAGTAGGGKCGVEKAITLKAVRVLKCSGSGSNSCVIAGIDAVTADHPVEQPAVANMSLDCSFSQAVNNAVTDSIIDGVTYALAAANRDFLVGHLTLAIPAPRVRQAASRWAPPARRSCLGSPAA